MPMPTGIPLFRCTLPNWDGRPTVDHVSVLSVLEWARDHALCYGTDYTVARHDGHPLSRFEVAQFTIGLPPVEGILAPLAKEYDILPVKLLPHRRKRHAVGIRSGAGRYPRANEIKTTEADHDNRPQVESNERTTKSMILYTIGLKKAGKKRLSLSTLQAIIESLDIKTVLDWRAEIDEPSIQKADLQALYGDAYKYEGRTSNEARITREALDRLVALKSNTILLFQSEAPGSCPRHENLALPLLTRGVKVSHVYEDEVIEAGELQRSIDAEDDYTAKSWRPTIESLNAKDAAALAKLAGKTQKPTNVMENAICLCVQRGTLGNSRKVAAGKITVNGNASGAVDSEESKIDKSMLRVTKMLVDSQELSAVNSLDGQLTKFLNTTCLPSILPHTRSTWMVPLGLLEITENRIQKFYAERKALIAAFCAAYPQRVKEAATKLAGEYDPEDYPSVEDVAGEFHMDHQYVEFGTPGKLQKVNAAMFEKQRQRMEAQFAETTLSVQQALRASMAGMVDHMVDALTGGEGGQPKKFRDATVTKLNEFLGMFDARNITNDAALKALVDRAKMIVKGVDTDLLKSSDSTRNYVAKGFEQIKTAMAGMIVARPKRQYRLDEE